jgi:hypothetical protein
LPVLSLAPYLASVEMFDEIGMDAIIEKRNKITSYLEFIINKCYQFFYSTSFYFLFNIEVITFKPPVHNRIENNNLYYLVLLRYQNTDWIDIGFVDYSITEKMIDWAISEKVGFPIKTTEAYMDEIVTLVYQANIKDVDNFTFKKRNPIKGSLFKKGIQDLNRSQILCELDSSIYEDYKDYCDYVSSLDKHTILKENELIPFDFLKQYFKRKMKQAVTNLLLVSLMLKKTKKHEKSNFVNSHFGNSIINSGTMQLQRRICKN